MKKLIKILAFISLTVLLLAILIQKYFEPHFECKDPEKTNHLYSFFVAGHVYGDPGIYSHFKKKFYLIKNDERVTFGILTGDIVTQGTSAQWDNVDKDLKTLSIPVYFAVGNHDILNRKLYEERYGSTYFSFVKHNDLFIILDPNLDHWNISGEQLRFLKKTLNEGNIYDNIFVFFHQVLWWDKKNRFRFYPMNSRFGRAETINFWTEIEPLFHQQKNNVYLIAGDVGARPYQLPMYEHYDNISLIASGMGGGVYDNFMIVHVNHEKKVDLQLRALNNDDPNALGCIQNYTFLSTFLIKAGVLWYLEILRNYSFKKKFNSWIE